MEPIRVVHYLNQFFGQLGGEEAAGVGPRIEAGPLGPGRQLQARLGPGLTIVATAICGDNTFADHPESTARELSALILPYRPDLVIAGPAFNSGRYGYSCGQLCATMEAAGIPALTGMYEENPAVEQFRSRTLIVRTGATARHTAQALDAIAELAQRVARGERIAYPAQVGCFPAGMRRAAIREAEAAERAVDMLLRKLAGEPFVSEISRPTFTPVTRATMRVPLSQSTIALLTDGGLVTRGNPERMPNGYTDRFTAVSIDGLRHFTPEAVEVNHGGYDTQFVNSDVNRLVPLDAARELEREGLFGRLYETVYATAGLGMALNNAREIGRQIGQRLVQARVDGAILTST